MTSDNEVHADKKNRTVICTVLFVDIVGFSECSVVDQTRIKGHFTEVVTNAVQSIAAQDRLLLDTGDGVAICLFGDPEEGLFLSFELQDQFRSQQDVDKAYWVRIGLNLGPIKIVTDVNQRFNAIGDGINVAQRVMSFAEPGQVLATRSYYEIVSRLSDDFLRLFEYRGVRHDKHVREHDVYQITSPSSHAPANLELEQLAELPQSGPSAKIDEATQQLAVDVLTPMLARIVGPIAKVIIQRALSRSASLEDAVGAIRVQIEDEVQGNQFVTDAMAKLASELRVDS